MGMIDDIAEKAAQKIADQAKKESSGSAVAKEGQANLPEDLTKPVAPQAAQKAAMDTLGLKETDVSPASIAAPAIETNPMPNTNPAARTLGLGETDIAPGGPPAVSTTEPKNEIPPSNPPSIQPVTAVAKEVPSAPAPAAKTGPGQPTAEISNEVSAASADPNFWKNLINVARQGGKSLLELIGDFAAGYSHQDSPTEQRLAREHQLRLQGNQMQAEKDLMSIKQGYDAKQAQLDRDFQAQWNQAKTDLDRQQLKQQYDLAKQNMRLEEIRINNEYAIQSMMYRWNTAQKVAQVGGPQGLFGGQ